MGSELIVGGVLGVVVAIFVVLYRYRLRIEQTPLLEQKRGTWQREHPPATPGDVHPGDTAAGGPPPPAQPK